MWSALRRATRATSLALFFKGRCLVLLGCAAHGARLGAVSPGPICEEAQRSERPTYLANLALFPGRAEFSSYLPSNTQGVVVQPVGRQGTLVVATDTQRGFSQLDQVRWVAACAACDVRVMASHVLERARRPGWPPLQTSWRCGWTCWLLAAGSGAPESRALPLARELVTAANRKEQQIAGGRGACARSRLGCSIT